MYAVIDSMVKGGKLKLLAITGTKRSERRPDLPTFSEFGLKGMDIPAYSALLAPPPTTVAMRMTMIRRPPIAKAAMIGRVSLMGPIFSGIASPQYPLSRISAATFPACSRSPSPSVAKAWPAGSQ